MLPAGCFAHGQFLPLTAHLSAFPSTDRAFGVNSELFIYLTINPKDSLLGFFPLEVLWSYVLHLSPWSVSGS